jgi:hypothetical protein
MFSVKKMEDDENVNKTSAYGKGKSEDSVFGKGE